MKFKFAFFAVLVALVSSLWAIDGAFAAPATDTTSLHSWQVGDVGGTEKDLPSQDVDKDSSGEIEEFAHIVLILPIGAVFGSARSSYDRERPREVSLPVPLKPPSFG